ncbi:hypothetical protein HOU00_gp044 [Caulobacter phage CcrPW]|uniref:Uncharacterized protein n=1 Tax=Caulobacter phage CcrPW TaxID=2283271 RepID=A0A385E9V0_9CAUD|nr:hypothetical protein HOU00_gp044 [Caulobacter phage CcrPW]AXQ68583.1 hypothetical protein CcrPW_gp044 [Caulobacter phage CcrPW]
MTNKTETAETTEVVLTPPELLALEWLKTFHKDTGAEWSTEAQWRAYADRPTITPDANRARGFRIPPMLAKGVIEMTTANIHIARYGVQPDPVALYRPV